MYPRHSDWKGQINRHCMADAPLFGNAFVGAGAEAAPDSPDTEVPGVALVDITGRKATAEPDAERRQEVRRSPSSPLLQPAEEGAAR